MASVRSYAGGPLSENGSIKVRDIPMHAKGKLSLPDVKTGFEGW